MLISKAGLCGNCNTAWSFPTAGAGLNVENTVQSGGIVGVALLKCDAISAFNSPTALINKTLWDAALTANDLKVINGCYATGSLADASNVATLGSCQRSVRMSTVKTLSFRDVEDNATFDRHAFWKSVSENPNGFYVAFQRCPKGADKGKIHAFYRASIQPSYSIGETTNDQAGWDVVITIFEELEAPLAAAFDFSDLVNSL